MNRAWIRIIPVLRGIVLSSSPLSARHTGERWKALAHGVECGSFPVRPLLDIEAGAIHVVRIDAAKARRKLLLASEHGSRSRATARWCKEFNLVSAINAGMYHKDLVTNVGYL